jgi:UDP-N-acetylmuramoyl-L-alanyl-D-glutamate--2,6-diaminopimelate ligase
MMVAEKMMPSLQLSSLLSGLVEVSTMQDCQVAGLQSDSRKVVSGDLFLACCGEQFHGLKFATQVVKQGAVAIVYDPAQGGRSLANALTVELPLIAVDSLTEKVGLIASRFYAEPTKSLRLVGVTGTNGKTSCTHFLAQALAGEMACSTVGTLGWGQLGNWHETTHTTPDAVELSRIMATLKSQGAEVVGLEVSSHAMVQGRTAGSHFEGAVYTNFSRDHLDYHGSFNDYIEAKLQLLKSEGLSFVVVNLDDEQAEKVLAAVPNQVITWGFTQKEAGLVCEHQLLASEVEATKEGLSFTVSYQGQSLPLTVPLIGLFNIDNCLAVLAILLAMRLSFQRAVAAVAKVKPITGRMEQIAVAGQPLVVVDYAHTPDALEKGLKSLRPHCKGSLKVLFGCGGDRDKGKRPLMGKVAAELADVVYLTDDNPRSESGDEIIADICDAGIAAVIIERDRKRAIGRTIEDSSAEDLILVAGKGHETTQQIGDLLQPFDDREVVRAALEARAAL